MDVKEGFCCLNMLMAAWAVPLLIFFGVLCSQESEMIELPNSQKKDAAWGCFGAAVLYALTFVGAKRYMAKLREEASARQVDLRERELTPLG
mmetsp:Transcript_33612/g.90986  ORF Transcript_33612/g.90986 Transcript_33612/m.90986 type:complete len:92 (-) Transcript_33612:142-417(-)